MSASLYKPSPENHNYEALVEYARRLEKENADLQYNLDYEVNRTQALVEIAKYDLDKDIMVTYRDSNYNKITTIKRIRYLYAIGLKEAMDYFNELVGH